MTLVSVPNPPSLLRCVSQAASMRAKVLAGMSVLSDRFPLLQHLRLLGHVEGFPVERQLTARGNPPF